MYAVVQLVYYQGMKYREAAEVLAYYRDNGGPIYNASHGHDKGQE